MFDLAEGYYWNDPSLGWAIFYPMPMKYIIIAILTKGASFNQLSLSKNNYLSILDDIVSHRAHDLTYMR